MKNFLKYLSVSVLSLLVMWTWFSIRKSGQPSEVVYKSIKATLNGTTTGTTYFEVTGWMVMDGGGNSFITGWALTGYLTGFTETDPVWLAASGDYLPLSGNTSTSAMSWDIWMWYDKLIQFSWSDEQYIAWWNQIYLYKTSSTWYWYVWLDDDNTPFMIHNNWSDFWVHMNWSWLVYDDDYSGDYTNRSLVDKEYVDGELSWIETFWEFDWVTLNPTATWDVSLKIGLGSQANTSNSASIGQYAWANWTGSYAFGNSAWALWEGSFAIGWQANADGRNAYSVWYNSEANQEDSYVFGVQSVANWFGSMTLWQYATSNNTFSTAIWYSSQANADYSISAGNNTITNSVSSMAIWKYNVWNADSVFEVGFGTNTDRANLFEVKNNWNIYVSKLTGYTCLATDSAGMVYDNTGVFANYVPYTAVDTGFNNTGSDTIIPSEKAIVNYISGTNIWNINWTVLSTINTWITSMHIWWLSFANILASMSLWYAANAQWIYSNAIGYWSAAEEEYASAFWTQAAAKWRFSTAIWYGTIARWLWSVAIGNRITAISSWSIALWSFNIWITWSILEIGDGVGGALHNILTIYTWYMDTNSIALTTDNAGLACTITGQIIFSGTDFLWCDGTNWLQFN